MNYLINLSLLLLITSCTSINFFKSFSLIEMSNDKDIFIESNYDQLDYITVSLSKRDKTIFNKIKLDNNIATWSDGLRIIKTLEGKIINTYGFKNNLEIIINSNLENIFFRKEPYNSYIRITSLEKDSSYLPIRYEYINEIKTTPDNKDIKIVKERYRVNKLRWKGENLYWLDSNGNVYKSTQKVSPFGPIIHIESK